MNLQVKYNTSKENWNSFLLQNRASFLQSFEWGEFQEKLGRKIWRLSLEDGPARNASQASRSDAGGQVLVVKKSLPFGKSYLYVPFGPCLASEQAPLETPSLTGQAMQTLLDEVRNIAKAEKAVYCYIEPFEKVPAKGQGPQKRVQPQQTLLIDLLPQEEQIFKSLKSKTTRYNIRFAQKKGVEFIAPEVIGDKEIDAFYNLAQQSATRDGFANYDKDYFKKLFAVSSEQMPIKLFFAKHETNLIAANIFVFFGETAVHLFGGFNHDFRHLMAPYFMHWNQMLFAKNKMGCTAYDFWGIDEKKWPGVTHFKRSFGGKEITYPQGFDLVYDKLWYKTFKMARKLLR